MKNHTSLTIIIILIFWVIIFKGYYMGYWRFNYPREKDFPVRGIDISHHQGKINWERVCSERISFVYMKATEGSDFKDPMFKRNWREAKAIGLKCGAYHFFSFRKSGAEQAKNFINTVPPEPGMLPPVIDFEFIGNTLNVPSRDVILNELSDFARDIKTVYGKNPVIYVTQDVYDRFLWDTGNQYQCWIRNVIRHPDLSNIKKWVFWQYANNGNIDGIHGRVDLDVFVGSTQEFQRWLQ
jgi:lysozyme